MTPLSMRSSLSSLNSKPDSSLTGEPVNMQLKNHALEVHDWQHRETLEILHTWTGIFNDEFNLGLELPAIRVDPISQWRLGTYRCGRNGFGLQHEITLNVRHLGRRSLPDTLCTLFHELLHEWQMLYGKVGRRNYHNRQFCQKGGLYGLIIDRHGHTRVEPGRFTSLLTRYGVDSGSLPSPEDPTPSRPRGSSKMRKYRCSCEKCGLLFEEAPPSW